mmetsp:Transcript_6889/g.9646  ORF Transcript_6889/g.9646 Transcript_6889/m.9646 type:complete len:94 (+) Transcript_6889:3-284(+)
MSNIINFRMTTEVGNGIILGSGIFLIYLSHHHHEGEEKEMGRQECQEKCIYQSAKPLESEQDQHPDILNEKHQPYQEYQQQIEPWRVQVACDF